MIGRTYSRKRLRPSSSEGGDKRSFCLEARTAERLKIQADDRIFVLQEAIKSGEQRRLTVLSRPVDDEILSRVDHGFDLFQPGGQIDHVVLGRDAHRGRVEGPHIIRLISSGIIPLLYQKNRSIATVLCVPSRRKTSWMDPPYPTGIFNR